MAINDEETFFTISNPNAFRDKVYVYKLWQEAYIPQYGSSWAACFDIKASLRPIDRVVVYDSKNNKDMREVTEDKTITLHSKERMLVPTGLVFDLREGTSLRMHPRSGLSLKNGIIIANCEGIVDADYVQQSYIMLHNVSDVDFMIEDGMRVAQGEIVYTHQPILEQVYDEPMQKTDRNGGFGSTGK